MNLEVGGYRTREILDGSGPVAVYLAERDGREVTLYLTEDLALGLEPERFLRQVAKLKELPAGLPIARVLEGGAASSMFWLAVEHHPGLTWAELYDRKHASLPPFVLALMLEELLGLTPAIETLHAAGVVHGGLCPQSIVLTEDGPLVLAHVGIASLFGVATAIDARYRAPEHWRSPLALRAHTDVYGLGVTLFQLAALRPPYHDRAPASLRECVMSDPLAAFGAPIPEPLRAIITRATAKEPGERFANVAELRRALKEAIGTLVPSEEASDQAALQSGSRRRSDAESEVVTPEVHTLRSSDLPAALPPGSPATNDPEPAPAEAASNIGASAAPERAEPPSALDPSPRGGCDGKEALKSLDRSETTEPPRPATTPGARRLRRGGALRRPDPTTPRARRPWWVLPAWGGAGVGLMVLGAVLHGLLKPAVLVIHAPATTSSPSTTTQPPATPVAPIVPPTAPSSREAVPAPSSPKPLPSAPAVPPHAVPALAAKQVPHSSPPLQPQVDENAPASIPSAGPSPPSAPGAHSGQQAQFPWQIADPCALSWYRCAR